MMKKITELCPKCGHAEESHRLYDSGERYCRVCEATCSWQANFHNHGHPPRWEDCPNPSCAKDRAARSSNEAKASP
jgi:hypothetical protein